jgi:hypothetical protein
MDCFASLAMTNNGEDTRELFQYLGQALSGCARPAYSASSRSSR